MKQIRPYATELIKTVRTPAVPSKFFYSIDDLMPCPVVLYVRVSAHTQKHNLPHQISRLKTELEKRGFTVIAVYWEIVPGWEYIHSEWWGRLGLERAILKAKEANGLVVAESVERFRRTYDPDWKKRPQPLPLTLFDMKRLMDEAEGVQLATLIHPDTPPRKVRSEQTKRGQAGKGNYGGRPKESRKARRLRLLPVARALWKKGCSYRRIARKLKIHWSTIRDWIKREEKSAHLATG